MALNLAQSNQKSDLGRIDNGSYAARVAQVIDLGIQHNTVWVNGASRPEYYVVDEKGNIEKNAEGYAKKTTTDTGRPVLIPKVQITFEFPTERIEIRGESKPRWQSKEYNITEKGALAKLVNALSPGSVKVGDILSKPCMVAIGTTSGGKAKVDAVNPMMKGMVVAELENTPTLFDFDNPDKATWDGMYPWLKDKIMAASNYEGSKLQKMVESESNSGGQSAQEFDDNDPFNY